MSFIYNCEQLSTCLFDYHKALQCHVDGVKKYPHWLESSMTATSKGNLAKWPLHPTLSLFSKIYPRDINYMPVVNITACLDFETESEV